VDILSKLNVQISPNQLIVIKNVLKKDNVAMIFLVIKFAVLYVLLVKYLLMSNLLVDILIILYVTLKPLKYQGINAKSHVKETESVDINYLVTIYVIKFVLLVHNKLLRHLLVVIRL
jgi:hypothetical protein